MECIIFPLINIGLTDLQNRGGWGEGAIAPLSSPPVQTALNEILHPLSRDVGDGWAGWTGWAIAHPGLLTLSQQEGVDCAPHITTGEKNS